MLNKRNNAFASIKIVEKMLGIEISLDILFKDHQYFSEKDVSTVFIKEGYYIVFNNFFIGTASLLEIMITGFHETRHDFKYGNKLPLKYQDDQLTINEWNMDFDIQSNFRK